MIVQPSRKSWLYGSALFLSCVVIAGLASYAALSRLSHATKYCPLTHKLNPDMVCTVKDRKADEILIEHHDTDLAKVELSIYQRGRHSWFKYPDCCNVSNVLAENLIEFDPQRNNSVLVNGISSELKPLR
jgi:hypothetical protein